MQPVYKCEYCKLMDTKEKIEEHEKICIFNTEKKNCYTCANRVGDGVCKIDCSAGYWLGGKTIRENCDKYIPRIITSWIDFFR